MATNLSTSENLAPTIPKRPLWKLSLVVTGAVMLLLLWHCGSSLVQGRRLADAAVHQFHERMNSDQYEVIWNDADERFRNAGSQEQVLKFLRAVHAKLGGASTDNLESINANATTNGTFIITRYNTAFTQAFGQETFTWVLRDGNLKLVGYNVQSDALVMN